MTTRAENRQKFMDALVSLQKPIVTRAEVKKICSEIGISGAPWFTKEDSNRVGRGQYRVPTGQVPAIQMAAQVLPMTKPIEKSGNKIANVATELDQTDLVPEAYKNYVPFGML